MYFTKIVIILFFLFIVYLVQAHQSTYFNNNLKQPSNGHLKRYDFTRRKRNIYDTFSAMEDEEDPISNHAKNKPPIIRRLNEHSNSKPNSIQANIVDDYENSVVEQTPDGEFKVVPLSELNTEESDELIRKISHKCKRNSNCSSCRNPPASPTTDLLQRIANELDDIKIERSKCIGKEGLPCRITGSWVSSVGGVRLDMTVTVNGTIHVLISDTIPYRKGILSKNWTIKGQAPFPKGGPFSLTAWHYQLRQIGNFVGQCRVCNLQEQINGWWVFARQARDCKDLHLTGEMKADVLRREVLHTLREEKINALHKIGSNVSPTTSEPLSTSKIPKSTLPVYHTTALNPKR